MVATTNAALELAELCETLRTYSDQALGEQVFAQHFRVKLQSSEFYQTVFVVIHRFEQLQFIVNQLDIYDSLKQEAIGHINTIKRAFERDGLQNSWNVSKNNFLAPAVVGPIKFLSPALNPRFSHVSLDDNEIKVLLDDVDQLISWLIDHQLQEQDFFRAAIIEGLYLFRFRLDRVRWLGWGYSLVALRDVIQAYLALNGIITDRNNRPDAGGMLMKLSAVIGRVCRAVRIAREVSETGEFLVDAYGKISELTREAPNIAGLISSTSSAGGS